MNWSAQQSGIFEFFANGKGNLVVRARAGTGKTTTIVEGVVNHAKDKRRLVAAFNKRIADELQKRLGSKADAKTLHALGFGFVRKHLGAIELDSKLPWKSRRKRALAVAAVGSELPEPMITLVADMITYGREMNPFAETAEDLLDIAYEMDCVPDTSYEALGWNIEKVCEYAAEGMRLAKKPTKYIDFSDMLFLPVVNGWAVPSYDLVCIDEAQDMNACQLFLAQGVCKPGGRVVVVGDDRQAIYGFRGADSNSIDRLKTELQATELPLTITYRCPRLVVEEANRIVPDYSAAPEAPAGTISNVVITDLAKHAVAGNFVLSRTNAALTKTCMELLRNNIRAKIEGKDIGKRLQTIAKDLTKAGKSTWPNTKMTLADFAEKLTEWENKEVEKALRADRESRAALIADQAACLRILSEGLNIVDELLFRIDDLFGEAAQQHGVVVCSTVHKAKGLESKRVFILRDTFYPGRRDKMSAGRLLEESNIEYVAITRAMTELTWVSGKL